MSKKTNRISDIPAGLLRLVMASTQATCYAGIGSKLRIPAPAFVPI